MNRYPTLIGIRLRSIPCLEVDKKLLRCESCGNYFTGPKLDVVYTLCHQCWGVGIAQGHKQKLKRKRKAQRKAGQLFVSRQCNPCLVGQAAAITYRTSYRLDEVQVVLDHFRDYKAALNFCQTCARAGIQPGALLMALDDARHFAQRVDRGVRKQATHTRRWTSTVPNHFNYNNGPK